MVKGAPAARMPGYTIVLHASSKKEAAAWAEECRPELDIGNFGAEVLPQGTHFAAVLACDAPEMLAHLMSNVAKLVSEGRTRDLQLEVQHNP